MNAPSLKDTFRSIEKDLQLRMYTHEHEIVMHLYEFGSADFAEIMGRIRASHNTTADALKMLTLRDVIRPFAYPGDRRVKRYRLAPWAGDCLDEGYVAMASWFRDRDRPEDGGAFNLTGMINAMERTLGFPCFSPQYEILSILFDAPGISNKAVHSICNLSRSYLQTSLGTFVTEGKVLRGMDVNDRRVATYRLEDGVATALNRHFANSYKWFAERFSHPRGAAAGAFTA